MVRFLRAAHGLIRSPDRRAKFAALDQGLDPPPTKKQPKRFQQPDLKPANENRTAKQRAAAIKADQEAYVRRLKATQEGAWKRHKAESNALWKDYRTSIQAIRDRHTAAADKIWKHKRNRNALPLSIQGFRDWKETREWKKLMERLKAEKRRFEYRERTLMGFLGNTLALVRPGMVRTGKGFLPVLFTLLVSGKVRRELMLASQALAKKALSEKHAGSRKARADKLRHIRDVQLATLSAAYDLQKAGARSAPRRRNQTAEAGMARSLNRARPALGRMAGGIRDQGTAAPAGRRQPRRPRRSRRRGRPDGQSGRRQGPCPAGPETPR